MRNFVFHNPTKVLFGQHTIREIGAQTAPYGKNILLVYGKGSIKRSQVYNQAVQSLTAASVSITEHPGVSSNPVLNHVRAGIAAAKKKRIDAVVAVGGGSVMDTAKAIGAGALVEHDVWKFFIAKKSITKTLPVLCVPTLAASGSEMNSAMVVTNEVKKQKFGFANRHLYPKASILDPTATFSVPPDYTAFGAVDAISHLLEFYFTTRLPFMPIQDRFMEGLILSIMQNCEQALYKPHDYNSRASLMWSASLALSGLAAAGLGKVGFPMHMIEHSLSALYDVPHGAGLSVVIPAWLRWQTKQGAIRLEQFSKRIFPKRQCNGIDWPSYGIEQLRQWFVNMGCPVTLKEIGVENEDIPLIAANSLALAKIWRMPEYTRETIEAILRLSI
jgi:alcohol dehydrogenase YqhD (iron-dependent ADH family)